MATSWIKKAQSDDSYLSGLIEDLKDYMVDLPEQESIVEPKTEQIKCPIHGTFTNLGDFSPSAPTDKRHMGGHQGTDLRAEKGTPVYAAHSGKVSSIGSSGKGGNSVSITGDKFKTYYAHLASIAVKVGDLVDSNTVIGTVGDTGNAKGTSPHLHFQVWENGTLKNPASYFAVPKFSVKPTKSAKAFAQALNKFSAKY